MRSDYVILGSILSEKSVSLGETKVYSLKVNRLATKCDIRKALKDVFNVDAVDINTQIVRGKTVRKAKSRKGGPVEVKRSNFKKAFVKLREGQALKTVVSGSSDSAS